MAPAARTATIMIQILLLSLIISVSRSAAQTCSTVLTNSNNNKNFTQCQSLSQGASLAWTFFSTNQTLEIAFSGTLPSSSGWAGWGYNPASANMAGSSALIAFSNSSGSHLMLYSPTGATKGGAALTPVGNSTSDLTLVDHTVQIQGSSVQFTALLRLTSGKTDIFHVWNRGSSVSGDSPQSHALDTENTNSLGSLNLATGASTQLGIPRQRLKNAHGLLNAIGWGILLPIGAMIARYMRPFEKADPAWFYLHIACQLLGFTLGVIGWAIGLNLGSKSVGVTYKTHRSIAITMFTFGCLQVLAIVLRPHKTNKYRSFWNVYHHSVGYTTIVLAVVNIFRGLTILDPAKGWRHAYIAIIVVLGVIALVLEVLTWFVYFHKRAGARAQPVHSNMYAGNSKPDGRA